MDSSVQIYPADEERRLALRDHIEQKYPWVGTAVLGKSIMSRPIDMYRIGTGKTNILLVGAHHAAEHITSSVIYSFMLSFLRANERVGKYASRDTVLYMSAYSLWIIPALNPDGIELSLYGIADGPLRQRQERMLGNGDSARWQANARGVDLNHNYSAGFSEYKRIETARGIEAGCGLYSGEFPESEPEVRALASLVRSVDFSLVISLHTQGEEIYAYPRGNRCSDRLAEYLCDHLGYKRSVPGDTALYGGLCDYTASLGIPSLTLELGRGENPIDESELCRITEKSDKALFVLPTLL